MTLNKLEIEMLVCETFTNEVLGTHPSINVRIEQLYIFDIVTYKQQPAKLCSLVFLVEENLTGQDNRFLVVWQRKSALACIHYLLDGLTGLTGAGDPHHWSRTLCKM